MGDFIDENVRVIRPEDFKSVNILSKNISLEDALNISIEQHTDGRINLFTRELPFGKCVPHTGYLYKHTPEYRIITEFFYTHMRNVNLHFSNILDMPNTSEDVKYRQDGVKEVTEKKDIAKQLYKILSNPDMFKFAGHPLRYAEILVSSEFNPEKLKWFLDNVLELEKYSPCSGPLTKVVGWAKNLKENTVFRELFAKKRKVTDSRIFNVYSERFDDVMYGLLKPEVKPEDVFDFLDDDLTKIELKKNSKRKESEERSIVKYKKAIDEEISNLTVTAARQRMDILNSITADKFMIQTLMVQMQLQQLYQGAVLYHTLKKNNYPVTFPTIEDTPGLMDLKKAMPTRLVLSNLSCSDSRYDCCPNDFYFRPEDQIIQIEGPNKRGKSEAWRTLHLTNLLINAGYPISAEYGRLGVNPESHFISCKGDSGNGGSELERSKEGIFAALVYVNKNDLVILDELGDSTNKFTAQEIGNRILPPLKEKNCKILITSHHDALTAEISKQFGGISLMPDSHGKDNGIYRLVPTAPNIDYKAGDVLDEIGFTESKIRSTISSSGRKNEITTGIDNGIDEDLPF